MTIRKEFPRHPCRAEESGFLSDVSGAQTKTASGNDKDVRSSVSLPTGCRAHTAGISAVRGLHCSRMKSQDSVAPKRPPERSHMRAPFEVMSHDMANKVIPFRLDRPAPLLTKRWRTIVNVNGALYALDVMASYSPLPSAPTGGEPLSKTQPRQPSTKPPAPLPEKTTFQAWRLSLGCRILFPLDA